MDPLTLFGLLAVSAMVVFYALEHRSAWFILAFSGACALGSVYGFLQGAWPFGLVESVWSLVAVRRWWLEQAVHGVKSEQVVRATVGKEEPEGVVLSIIRETGKAKRVDLLPRANAKFVREPVRAKAQILRRALQKT